MQSINDKSPNDKSTDLDALVTIACSLGASEAAIISPDDIVVEERLADFCNRNQCDSYGLSPGCPPNVSGPSGFRALQKKAKHALVFRITVPSAALFSDERIGIMRLLHEIAATVEQEAYLSGYSGSIGFAGGSCRKIFCEDLPDCNVLAGTGECRHPKYARSSMSGFGINVSELMKICGWPSEINTRGPSAENGSMSWVAGLVLIGQR